MHILEKENKNLSHIIYIVCFHLLTVENLEMQKKKKIQINKTHPSPTVNILEYFPFLLFSTFSYTYTDLFCMFAITLYVCGVPLPLSHVSL